MTTRFPIIKEVIAIMHNRNNSHLDIMSDRPSSSTTLNRPANAAKLRQEYQQFLQKAATLFSKVDQNLLMNILYYENKYRDWEGNVLLELVYPAGTDMDQKREWIYQKYQRMGSVEQDKTLRFKGIRIYLEDIDQLLNEDPQIQYITGSASISPGESYTSP
jgi:hypothetical protein